MSKDYFQSQEFLELLQSYEEQRRKGESVYLDADDFADIADYYLNIDRPRLAMKAIEEGLSLHPDDEVLLIVEGAAYIYQRKFVEAEQVLKTLDDQNSDVQYQLAQIQYAKYHNTEKAERIWREWMKLESGNNPSEEQQRECYIHILSSMTDLLPEQQCDMDAVRRWIREYIDRFQPLGRYDEDVQLADICRDNEQADLMCEVLAQVLEEQPYLPKGWSNLALAQYMQQHYDQALESCDFALAVNPQDLDALLTKAHSLYSMGEKRACKPCFKEYLDKGGDAVQIIPYAESLFFDGEKEEAQKQLEKLYSHYEKKRMDMMAGVADGKTTPLSDKKARRKKKELDEFLSLYGKVLTDISDLYHQNELFEMSILINEQLTKVFKHNAEAYFMLGVNHLALSQYEDASRNFANALQYADDQVMMGLDIALTFVLNGFDKFALEVLNAVCQIADSSDSPFVKNIPAAKSLAYLKLGYTDQFLKNFKIACQETPQLVESVYEGYFPANLPVTQWSDYAEKEVNTLMAKFSTK